jgi:hypothetical protein
VAAGRCSNGESVRGNILPYQDSTRAFLRSPTCVEQHTPTQDFLFLLNRGSWVQRTQKLHFHRWERQHKMKEEIMKSIKHEPSRARHDDSNSYSKNNITI